MKILTIVGARPQFVKAAALSREIKKYNDIEEVIVHTGQHYDKNMSDLFFEELEIPKPKYNLNIGSGTHAYQTAEMLKGIEDVLVNEKPDFCLVYGDTNSTLAGALAASKLHIPIAHVEAGLRSYNKRMPEEINRITTDHVSSILFPPTENASQILDSEGLGKLSFNVGDIMLEVVNYYSSINKVKLEDIVDMACSDYYLCTIHRQENTNPKNMKSIFSALNQLNKNVILPLHPRTKNYLDGIDIANNIKIIEPVGYFEMLCLLKNAAKVLTDSGGLQKEAFFLKKPCITLREETEWIETLKDGWNHIVGADTDKILEKVKLEPTQNQKDYFGKGNTAELILNHLKNIEC
jgi:UDP-GlcNAc3NAcA epimerase